MTGSVVEGDAWSIYLIRRGLQSAHLPTELLAVPCIVLPSPVLQGKQQRMCFLTPHAALQCIFPLLAGYWPDILRAGWADCLFLQIKPIHLSQANQIPLSSRLNHFCFGFFSKEVFMGEQLTLLGWLQCLTTKHNSVNLASPISAASALLESFWRDSPRCTHSSVIA